MSDGQHFRVLGANGYTGSRVLMPDGTPIPGVRTITWTHEAGLLPQLRLVIAGPELEAAVRVAELVGITVEIACPHCGDTYEITDHADLGRRFAENPRKSTP